VLVAQEQTLVVGLLQAVVILCSLRLLLLAVGGLGILTQLTVRQVVLVAVRLLSLKMLLAAHLQLVVQEIHPTHHQHKEATVEVVAQRPEQVAVVEVLRKQEQHLAELTHNHKLVLLVETGTHHQFQA
jgi:hypothetical protein